MLVLAIVLIAFGHGCKSLRLKQIFNPYKDVSYYEILKSLTVGQAVNMCIPFRIGDIVRIKMLSRRFVRNGFLIATLTIALDIMIDLVTVSCALALICWNSSQFDGVYSLASYYISITGVLFVFGFICAVYRKKCKLTIYKVSCLLDKELQRKFLISCYTAISSFKELLRFSSIIRILLYSTCTWICYILSYISFATFLNNIEYNISFTQILVEMFSVKLSSMIYLMTQVSGEIGVYIYFGVYLIIPILFIYFLSIILRRSKIVNQYDLMPQTSVDDRFEFLKLYFTATDSAYYNTYLKINAGIRIIKDCSAGSNATTILCDDNGLFYRKYTFGEDSNKLERQCLWLLDQGNEIPVAKILYREKAKDYFFYDMPNVENSRTLSNYIQTLKVCDSMSILEDIIMILEEKLYHNIQDNNLELTRKYIKSKLDDNLTICNIWLSEYYPLILNSEYIFINGVRYKALSKLTSKLNVDYFYETLRHDKITKCHGDLTLENIIYNGEHWYFIDPNTENIYSTKNLDYSKILQSLHGNYENLLYVENINVIGNQITYDSENVEKVNELYTEYNKLLSDKFSVTAYKSIYLHEIIHFFRLMPYKIKNNPKTAIVYYSKLIVIVNDIFKRFDDEK